MITKGASYLELKVLKDSKRDERRSHFTFASTLACTHDRLDKLSASMGTT
jgi:hypothetical protein